MIINSKFLITTVILCFTSMVAMAEGLSVFSVKVADKNTFVLQLTHAKQAQIQVILKDAEGVALYNETLMQYDVDQRKFSLRELPSGTYTLMVAYDAVIKVQPIKKGHETLEIEAEELQTVFQPVFRQHSEYVDLDMLCLSDLEISLEIKDAEGHVIYTELVQPKGAVQKRFNLSQLKKGSYTITVGVVDAVLNKEFKEVIEWSPTIAD